VLGSIRANNLCRRVSVKDSISCALTEGGFEMQKLKLTDLLLLLVFLALLVNILIRIPLPRATADTFRLDDCITTSPDDKPAAYLHVVNH
jgi:hypothetical protein